MRIAYFDCFSGASGDMINAALLDAGASEDALRTQLAGLPLPGFEVSVRRIKKQGFAATQFQVSYEPQHKHRHLSDVLEILRAARFSRRVTGQACAIFQRLAEAEARVHGTVVEKIHFHEVGAVDAIVDVAGACLSLENLGVERVLCSPIPVGSGTVTCDHGVMPVPAPATAELLKGVPLAECDEMGELTTPTGAAVLVTLAQAFVPAGELRIENIGYGAGTRDGRSRPNVLRVLVGDSEATAASDLVAVLEANIDDQSPELIAHTLERLLEQGALDAYCQPILMKKGRPGVLLSVLCTPDQRSAFEQLIFSETSTFGIRHQFMQRSKLSRRHETVELEGGPIRIKVGALNGRDLTAAPEFEDCRIVAERSGVPLKEIMARALRSWQDAQR